MLPESYQIKDIRCCETCWHCLHTQDGIRECGKCEDGSEKIGEAVIKFYEMVKPLGWCEMYEKVDI